MPLRPFLIWLSGLALAAVAAHAQTSVERGAALYQTQCVSCHQASGEGIRGVFPPLAGSDFLLADRDRSIRFVLQGNMGQITVNRTDYTGAMPPHPNFDDQMV